MWILKNNIIILFHLFLKCFRGSQICLMCNSFYCSRFIRNNLRICMHSVLITACILFDLYSICRFCSQSKSSQYHFEVNLPFATCKKNTKRHSPCPKQIGTRRESSTNDKWRKDDEPFHPIFLHLDCEFVVQSERDV